jgi:hypothetical protein
MMLPQAGKTLRSWPAMTMAAAVSFCGPVPITYLDTEGGVHT